MREPDTLARVAAALRAFHDGPAIPGTFDSFRVVETYRATALERGGRVPEDYDWAHELAGRIEAKRSADAPVPCHNDLLNANFLDDGERLCIVDWEYAGMGDRFFDLANFSINHELDDGRERDASRRLLRRACATQDVQALALMRFMSDFREAMWGVVQSAVSELDFDFDGVRERALRATPPDGGVAGVRGGARAETTRGALRAPLASDCRRASRRLRSAARTRRAAPPRAAPAPPPCPCGPGP